MLAFVGGRFSKLGQSDLVFGVQSGFIRRSLYARLQVCVLIRVTLVNPFTTDPVKTLHFAILV